MEVIIERRNAKIPTKILDLALQYGKNKSPEAMVNMILDSKIGREWFKNEYKGNEFNLRHDIEIALSKENAKYQAGEQIFIADPYFKSYLINPKKGLTFFYSTYFVKCVEQGEYPFGRRGWWVEVMENKKNFDPRTVGNYRGIDWELERISAGQYRSKFKMKDGSWEYSSRGSKDYVTKGVIEDIDAYLDKKENKKNKINAKVSDFSDGDKIQHGNKTGVIEQIRGDIALILWDDGKETQFNLRTSDMIKKVNKKNEKLIRKEDFSTVKDLKSGDVFTWKGTKYKVTKKISDPEGVYVEEVKENNLPYKFRNDDGKLDKGKSSYGSKSNKKGKFKIGDRVKLKFFDRTVEGKIADLWEDPYAPSLPPRYKVTGTGIGREYNNWHEQDELTKV